MLKNSGMATIGRLKITIVLQRFLTFQNQNKMLKEFKEFIQRGNVLELAVGFILATYFGKIVSSLVDDIIMPPIGLALGGVDFSKMKMVLKEGEAAVMQGETVVSPEVAEVAIRYGQFINIVLTFIIVAFCVFMIVKAYNHWLKKKEVKKEEKPPQPTKEVQLLEEIRDALRT